MTRKEQINQAAEESANDCPYPSTALYCHDFFIKGAEWADSHAVVGGVHELSDNELFAELRERGYSGKLYKQVEFEL